MKKNILSISIAAFIYRQYGTQSYLLRPAPPQGAAKGVGNG